MFQPFSTLGREAIGSVGSVSSCSVLSINLVRSISRCVAQGFEGGGGLRPSRTPPRSVSGAPAGPVRWKIGICANTCAVCTPPELLGSMLR
eukprot:5529537-Alexandrium_andersonii.AAC.1